MLVFVSLWNIQTAQWRVAIVPAASLKEMPKGDMYMSVRGKGSVHWHQVDREDILTAIRRQTDALVGFSADCADLLREAGLMKDGQSVAAFEEGG